MALYRTENGGSANGEDVMRAYLRGAMGEGDAIQRLIVLFGRLADELQLDLTDLLPHLAQEFHFDPRALSD